MEPLIEEQVQESGIGMFNPITYALQFLAAYGWYLVGGLAATLYALHRLRPTLDKWRQAREDAEYHKNPDVALARMQAIQQAREKQQQLLLEASQRAAEQQREREEKKRRENAERLQKYASVGHTLADAQRDDDYMPLSAGASTSSYRPPKRSKCGGGGCGK